MTEIRDLLEARYRELLAAAFTAPPNQLPDPLDNPTSETETTA